MQMSRIKRIQQLGFKYCELIESVAGISEMIRGSFNTVYRKCGKPNCRCARGVGHPSDQIVFLEGSRSKCRVVPKEDVQWVKRMTENRRKFRRRRQLLRALEKEIQREINELEEETISRSMGEKDWLK